MNVPHRMIELFWLSDGGSDLSSTRNIDIEHTIEPIGHWLPNLDDLDMQPCFDPVESSSIGLR
jgi:hypothetical protein